MERIILHSDINNFYASVECLYNPSLINKPVAVGGNVETRQGIILAKNYIAKRFNIKTGDTIWQAKQKCPNLVVVPPNYNQYMRFSKLAYEIYQEYTDKVEPFGLDESWLDVTGSTSLFGNGFKIADTIKSRIKYELGVTVSIGVSFNKVFAKLGSDMKKPNAITVITRDDFKQKVWGLPVSNLLYVGPATTKKCKSFGIHTIGQLAQSSLQFMQSMLGKRGVMLWHFANGLDTSSVSNIGSKPLIKSIGNSTTTPRDLTNIQDVKIILYKLSESVATRLREYNFKCRTVQITIRDKNLSLFERQMKLNIPSNNSKAIFDSALQLFTKNHIPFIPVRSLGVRASNLFKEEYTQLSHLSELVSSQNQDTLESTIDNIRNRFGHFSIQRGIMLIDKDLSKVNPKDDHIIHPVGWINS